MIKINKESFLKFIVNQPFLLRLSLKLLNATEWMGAFRNKIIAKSIDGIYSAGETLQECKLHVESLQSKNIGSIINYAVETGKNKKFIITSI